MMYATFFFALAAALSAGARTLGPADFGSGGVSVWGASSKVPAETRAGTARLRFVCRGPVSLEGANLVSFDADGKELKRAFLWPSLKLPDKSQWNRPSVHAYPIRADLIAPGAARVAVLYGFRHKNAFDAAPPVFEILGDELDWCPVPHAARRGNWFVLGEDVVFRSEVPEGKTGLRVRVTDAEGQTAFAGDVPGGEWRWRPAQVGFYTVRFAWLDAQGVATPATASLATCCRHKTVGDVILRTTFEEFTRDCQSFAVTPTAARTAAEAPPLFGFNLSPHAVLGRYGTDPDFPFEQIAFLGMNAFIRYHHFAWDEIERKGRGQYDWKDVDRAFEIAARHGYGLDRILVNPFGTPAWLTSAPPGLKGAGLVRPRLFAPKDMAPWRDFIRAFVTRYPEMRYIELWNEPHLPGYSIFWQKSSPQQFVDLMKAGYLGAKEAKRDITVLMGGQGMRYLPFYEEYVRLGGVAWFDQVDTHCGYNMQHFREAEKRLGVESKPYWEGEWHTVLYNCNAPEIPSEETCAYRMLTNMADLMHEDYRRITGFGLQCGDHVPETARFFAKADGIQQVSGLFRSQPFDEPRLAALALRTATDRFAGAIARRGAWAFGDDGTQRLAAFSSDRGTVAFVWSANPRMTVGGWTPQMRAAIDGRRILDWTGREVALKAMKPLRVYFVCEPDLVAAAKGGVKLDHLDYASYNYKPPLAIACGGYAPLDTPVWNACADGKTRFAASLDAESLTVDVRRRGDPVRRLVFAVDVVGKGILEDVVEFQVTSDGRIVKLRTPALMGDIPCEFSPAGVPLKKSRLARSEADGEESWKVRVAMSDLYPFVHSPHRMVPFSLVVADARGEVRWGGGLERIRKPAEFGRLRPSGGGRVVARETDWSETTGDGAGLAVRAKFVPGSVVRVTGSVRSSGRIYVSAWPQDGKGRGLGRLEAAGPKGERGLGAADGWQDVDMRWEMMPDARSANFRLFIWRDPAAKFEVRNLRLVND